MDAKFEPGHPEIVDEITSRFNEKEPVVQWPNDRLNVLVIYRRMLQIRFQLRYVYIGARQLVLIAFPA